MQPLIFPVNREISRKSRLSFIEETLKHFGLLVRVSGQNPDDVLRTTKLDKKMVGNQIKFILLKTPGDAYIEKI
ncbi:MAG: hypothetical protein ACLVCH_15265 [Roseburia inulinivorans]